jgi:hypothetical protein
MGLDDYSTSNCIQRWNLILRKKKKKKKKKRWW